ncbi:hypothetical protein MMC30_008276 [Trapelia coarctata]|nr:hypothetical protein [Trapelia coarctata]
MSDPTVTVSKYRTSCDRCLTSKVKCSRTKPVCWRCSQSGQRCVYSPFRRIGRPRKTFTWNGPVQQDPEEQRQRQQQEQEQQQQQQQGDNAAANNAAHAQQRSTQTQMTSAMTPEEMDLSLAVGTPWPYGQMTPQEQPPGADDLTRALEGLPDLDPFDFELPSNTFGDLDFFLDAPPGPLPSPAIPELSTPISTPHSCWDPALFAPAHNPPSSACSSAPSRSSPADNTNNGTTRAHSQPTMLVLAELLNTSNPQPVSGISTSHAHSNPPSHTHSLTRPLLSKSHPYHDADKSSTATSRHRTPFERYPALSHPQAPPRRTTTTSSSSHPRARSTSSSTATSAGKPLPDQCSNKCYSALSAQLARLSGCAADGPAIPLDLLLSLDRDVHCEKEKALNCAPCLRKTSSRPTLMLVIMVLEHLLGLFEREYGAELAAALGVVGVGGAVGWRRVRGGGGGSGSGSGDGNNGMGNGGSGGRNRPRERERGEHSHSHSHSHPHAHTHNHNHTHNTPTGRSSPLLRTDKPLLVGDIEVEEDIKAVFLRQLLRLHLDRLMSTQAELEKAVAAGLKDVNFRIAREMLVDIRRRILFLQGLLALTDEEGVGGA